MSYPLNSAIALFSLAALAGCSSSEPQNIGSLSLEQGEGQEDVVEVVGAGGSGQDGDIPASEQVSVRLVHLSADLFPIDLYLDADESPVVKGLAYGESTAAHSINAAMHDLRLTAEDSPTALLELAAFPLDVSPNITLAVVGSNAAGSLNIFDQTDLTGPMPDGAYRLHMLHAAPGFVATGLNVARFEGSNPIPVVSDMAYLSRDIPSFDLPTREAVYGVDVNGDSNYDYVYDVPAMTANTVVNMFFTDGPAGSISLVVQAWDGSTSVIQPR